MGTRLYFLSSAVWQQPALPTAVVLMGSRGTRMLQALSSCADCTPLCVSRPQPAVEHKQAFLGLSRRKADLCPHISDGWGQVEQQDVRACAVSCIETWGSTRLHGVCGWTECMEELLWHTSLSIFLIMPRACCMLYRDSHFSSREAAKEQGQDRTQMCTAPPQARIWCAGTANGSAEHVEWAGCLWAAVLSTPPTLRAMVILTG